MSDSRHEAFEREAVPHLNALYRTATRVLRNAADAGDVVQETFLQAWKSFDKFEQGTNCRAWLFKILFYSIHHHRRRAFRFNLKLTRDEQPGIEETIAWEPPVKENLEDRAIVAAFDTLPDHYREVVLLVDVHELTYKEAAEALDVPIGTVMSRLSRGRKALRETLAEHAKLYGIGAAVA